MHSSRSSILLTGCMFLFLSAPASFAGRLSLEFAGGGNEVTLAWGETVQIDLIWTMHGTDTPKTLLSGINLRFNVNDVADPDGTDRNDAFTVDDASTFISDWTMDAASGIGGFFSEFGLFLSAIHPDAVTGVEGNGSEFETVIASFVLRQAGAFVGDTFITLRHNGPTDILPDATQSIADGDGNFEWLFRFQAEVENRLEFDLGLGNPGDGGPQWPAHGLEPFEPLIIHSDAADRPAMPDDPEDSGSGTQDGELPSPDDNGDAPGPIDPGGQDGGEDPLAPDDSDSPAYEPPDRDADGVPKGRDHCPQTLRGKAVDANGCAIDDPMRRLSDADGDGVLDKDDDCPRTRYGRAADARGCAYEQRDDDGDGIKNGVDVCDDTPYGEPINRQGCSATRTDSDTDSVADANDLCPESRSGEAVDAGGCTAEQAAELLRPPASPARTGGGVGCGAVGMIPVLLTAAGLVRMRRR